MNFGMFGAAAALGISAVGSAIGLAIAGQATIGAWKRCYMNNKPAPFILVAFAGAPLTQTIYGFLLMNAMLASVKDAWYLLGVGLVCGLAIAASAMAQGSASAAGSDALAETGKGFSQYITIVGLCETVALFVMVFGLISV
ncbi:MAG TPA: V-type ATP synthase subunit K [Treponemataceae bacterium]|jgi:V/A-type H+-transporting ATPase subunit K|nr:V-type ATP synthase subunit K [Treponema sp.]OQB03232.1 MAG: V-type ATP synthase subunit K [Spirochaetes bacterium ADurb.Bin215]HOF86159.1 V-type ATP synthase subunit K [Treponemataceae bacterium]HOU37528.1 V-type ATP synthase subunit K [Treponemataceae bacterium]HPA10697.1 V-type ATP synthase subunit K [Treponemataceae bacterium]